MVRVVRAALGSSPPLADAESGVTVTVTSHLDLTPVIFNFEVGTSRVTAARAAYDSRVTLGHDDASRAKVAHHAGGVLRRCWSA